MEATCTSISTFFDPFKMYELDSLQMNRSIHFHNRLILTTTRFTTVVGEIQIDQV